MYTGFLLPNIRIHERRSGLSGLGACQLLARRVGGSIRMWDKNLCAPQIIPSLGTLCYVFS